MYNNIVVGNCG